MPTTLSPSERLLRLRPGTFSPSVVRGLTRPDGGLASVNAENGQLVTTTAIGETGSYRYDTGYGVKSTQQLNVDWSDFTNHVFFNSAQVKVNAAFNKIIDRYPFDGTSKETELFFDGLTGFERYVYDSLPKNKGYLFFSGSNTGDPVTYGTWVTVKDIAGTSFPLLTKQPDGANRLDPLSSSVTFQMQLWLPSGSNSNQIVFQKMSTIAAGEQHGIGCFVSGSAVSTAPVSFYVVSGSVNVLSVSVDVNKGSWTPVAFVWDRTTGELRSYVSGALFSSSSNKATLGNLNFATASMLIGTGSNISVPLFTPQTTFSGAIDEFRYYKSVVTTGSMVSYQSSSIYADPSGSLALYFKFNEPSGSSTNLVIDSSGNGMHGTLNSYAADTLLVRNVSTGSLPIGSDPMAYEDIRKCPVLFPDHVDVQALRTSLLSDASSYDSDNPNHIVKLIPKQFLLYGQQQNAFSTEEGQLHDLTYGSEPGSVALGSTQTLLSLLYMWATFFDEMKIYLDAFSTLRHVDYDNYDTVPDVFLKELADFYGLELPPLFVGSTVEQFINGNNITPSIVNSENTLQYLQNQIWRRILINANDILKSKGTMHSIKALLRAVGIDGDNIFRFKEHGGPVQRSLTALRESRNEVGAMLDFSGGGCFETPPLSGSRVEPGVPLPSGSFVTSSITGRNTATTYASDGLYTSGSWTIEGIWVFPSSGSYVASQSLVRLQSSGSSGRHVLANLFAISGSGLYLYAQPNSSSAVTALTMSLTGADVFDGQAWNISFGRERGEDFVGQHSSSYFLRAARNSFGDVAEQYVTSSLFNDNYNGDNMLQRVDSDSNASGCFVAVGSSSLSFALNDRFADLQSTQTLQGRVAQVRFWSKALTAQEWKEHVRDYKSLGVENPLNNFNFSTNSTGSFERLRLDISTDQPVTASDSSGIIRLFDFSQNTLHGSGTGFPVTSSVIVPQRFYYSFISPKFDEFTTNNKVRVRSFQDLDAVINDEAAYAIEAPAYEITQEQTPQDDAMFSIDFSAVDAVNQDMAGMFASLNILNDILGAPNMMFSGDYPDLTSLRNIYFNRLVSSLNLRNCFAFYKWFNTNIGKLIAQLIPRKTVYRGTNYVIESHMLERPKVEYHFEDMYIGNNVRNVQKSSITVQQLTGKLRKY